MILLCQGHRVLRTLRALRPLRPQRTLSPVSWMLQHTHRGHVLQFKVIPFWLPLLSAPAPTLEAPKRRTSTRTHFPIHRPLLPKYLDGIRGTHRTPVLTRIWAEISLLVHCTNRGLIVSPPGTPWYVRYQRTLALGTIVERASPRDSTAACLRHIARL